MKDEVVKTLRKQGYELFEVEHMGYIFYHDGIAFMWMTCEDDIRYLSLAIPKILEREEVSELEYYQLMDRINGGTYYVKAVDLWDCIWLIYDREWMDSERPEKLINRMIQGLEEAFAFAQECIKDIKRHKLSK